jgi:pimeloyl-ACP methyl ester carboxylesterase
VTSPPERTLVLIPGLVCDEAVWAAQVAAFAKDYQVLVVDHGELDSLAAMADRVLEQAPERFAVAGHSMGGRVALEIVRRAGERVSRLALLDTGFEALAPGPAGVNEIEKRHALLAIARQQGMRAMAVEWARNMVHPDRLNDAALMNAIYDMVARKTPEQFAAQIRALLARPDAREVLAAIRCPTLVLCGRQDAWAPWARHEEIARRIANSTLVGIDRCGHMAPMEQPDAVTSALRTWLTDR